jgi:hypothetical protein
MDPITAAKLAVALKKKKEAQTAANKKAIGEPAAFAGDLLQLAGNAPGADPNFAVSGVGGAVSGAGKALASGGGLGEVLSGGFMGAATGLLRAAVNKTELEQQKYDREKSLIQDSVVSPFMGYAKEGGHVTGPWGEDTDLIPIQAEKYKGIPEIIAFPDMSLVETKATMSHEEMGHDDPTDIVSESFIFSARKDFHKKDLTPEQDLLGFTPAVYVEGEESKPVQKILFTDILGKENKLTHAEVAKKIQKKFKISSREKDIFTEAANKENRESREPYIKKLVEIATEELTPGEFYGYKVKKYPFGGMVTGNSLIDDYMGEIDSEFTKMGNRAEADYIRKDKVYEDLFRRQGLRNTAATGLQSLTNAMQRTYVRPPQYSSRFADQMYEAPTRSMIEGQRTTLEGGRRAGVSALTQGGARVGDIGRYLSGTQTGITNAMNSAMVQYNNERLGQNRGKAGFLNSITNKNIEAGARADQMTMVNENMKIGQFGDILTRGMQNADTIDANRIEAGEQGRKSLFDAMMQQSLNKLKFRGQGYRFQSGQAALDKQNSLLEKYLKDRDSRRQPDTQGGAFINYGIEPVSDILLDGGSGWQVPYDSSLKHLRTDFDEFDA